MSSTEESLKTETAESKDSPEDGAETTAVPGAELNIEALQIELERAQGAAKDFQDKWLRTQAEIENLRRRANRDVENAHKYGMERFAAEMLNVKDSLELGLSAASETRDVAKLAEGMELTLKQLAQAMEKFKIAEIDPKGESFDPERHQAMTLQESSEHAPNTVIAVFQKGYTLQERLLRPAMVVVAKAPES